MTKAAWTIRPEVAMIQIVVAAATLCVLIVAAAAPGSSQSNPELQVFFRKNVGLTQEQIESIRSGQAVSKTMPSRAPGEVFLLGAVFVHAAPESYLKFRQDFERLRKLPNYLALTVLSNPPQLSDFRGFSFDKDDIKALQNCKPGDCLIQMPTNSMEEIQRSINWSAPDVNDQVNRLLQKDALERVIGYEREGNQALGAYNDKSDPIDVARQFAYMLSNDKVLPERLPGFYHYLLAYPNAKPENVEDTIYWAKVKFGLKPTLRVVQTVTLRGGPADPVAYAVAEKQLYASHYFETALDLSFCVRGSDGTNQPGFYLIMYMGSEQAGLTGAKGSIVRKVAVARSVSNLQDALTSIKTTLEDK